MPDDIVEYRPGGAVARGGGRLPAERLPRGEAMGREATAEEAARALAGVEMNERAAEMMDELRRNLAGREDEITDAQALEHVRRRQGAQPLLAPNLARPALQGPAGAGAVAAPVAAPDVPDAADPVPRGAGQPDAVGDVAPDVARGPAPREVPANLPQALAARRGLPAVAGAGGLPAAPLQVEPRWLTFQDLPAYLENGLRGFGRQIFGSFPCFREQEALARRARRDPLGEIRVLANLGGMGPSRREEVDQVMRWVSANGMVVDASQIEFPAHIRGYQPRIVLAGHGDLSYLLVEDRVQDGAPMEGRYIYTWKGGMDFYLRTADGLDALARMQRGGELAGPAPAPAARGMPVVAGAARIVAAVAAPFRRTEADGRRRARMLPAPDAPAPSPSAGIIRSLRDDGYMSHGTPDGPAMRKETDDGAILVLPEEGRSLALSQTFRLRRLDATGAVVEEGSMSELADLDAFAAGRAPGP